MSSYLGDGGDDNQDKAVDGSIKQWKQYFFQAMVLRQQILHQTEASISVENRIITVRNSSCGKVMFSQASVILSTGVCAWQGGMRGRGGWVHGRDRGGGMRARRDGHCSGRNTSNWNAFLLTDKCPM